MGVSFRKIIREAMSMFRSEVGRALTENRAPSRRRDPYDFRPNGIYHRTDNGGFLAWFDGCHVALLPLAGRWCWRVKSGEFYKYGENERHDDAIDEINAALPRLQGIAIQ